MTVRTSGLNKALWAGGLLFVAVSLLWRWQRSESMALVAGYDERAYDRTYAFILEKERWCSFRIPPDKTAIKLVSNAAVSADIFADELEYVIRFQAVAASGALCMDRTYSLKAGRKFLFLDGAETLLPSHLFGERQLSPLGSKVVLLSLRGLEKKPDLLRIRLEYAQPAIHDVCMRVYHRKDVPDYKLYSTWRRLSRDERANLAKFNVYDEELLRKEEKHNLLRSRWVALAPRGIEGRDFTQRKLYYLKDDGTRTNDELVQPEGLYVAAHHRGVVPLPPGPGRYLWRFRPLEETLEFAAGETATLLWQGDEERVYHLPLSGRESTHTLELDGGVVLVTSEGKSEFVVTVHRMDSAGATDCTPEEVWVTGYLLEWGLDLEYTLGIAENGGLPFRLDLRRVFFPGDDVTISEPVFLQYQVLDEAGSVIAAGDVRHEMPPSLYDMLTGTFADCRISDPSRYFLVLPPAARAVRLSCYEGNVLVTGYTRPAGLARRVRIPEDYNPFDRDARRNWFFLRPENAADWQELNHQVIVNVQTRPGRGQAEGRLTTVMPNERAYARHVLVPAKARETPSPARFLRLPVTDELPLFWGAVPGPLTVRPRLLCLRTTSGPEALTLFLDGEVWHRLTLTTYHTDVSLPGITAGRHTVCVAGPRDAAVYVNQAAGAQLASSFLVRAASLLRDTLSFTVTKREDETGGLSFRLYLPADNARRLELRAELSPRRRSAVPLSGWTSSAVTYDVAPPEAADLPVLFAGKKRLVGERVLFLALGTDLEAGEYLVRLTLESGEPCLVHCGERVSEHEDTRRIYIEEPVSGVSTAR